MENVLTKETLYGFEFREFDERRVDPEERKTYEIKRLWQLSHEIINLAAKGYKGVDIADILHIHPQTVSNTLNSELGKKKLAELREVRDADTKKDIEKINALKDKAINLYHEIFDDESGKVSLMDKKKVADTVLMEFSGLRKPTVIKADSTHTVITRTELAEIKQRALAEASQAGIVIDVTPEQDSDDEDSEAETI